MYSRDPSTLKLLDANTNYQGSWQADTEEFTGGVKGALESWVAFIRGFKLRTEALAL